MRSLLFSICSWVLVAAGVFVAALGGLDYWDSKRGQREIADQWQQEAARVVPADSSDSGPVVPGTKNVQASKILADKRPVTRAGDTVARLSIPRLSAVLYVVEGTSAHDLRRGPGHLEGSVLPGQDGNCVIAGHRDTHFNVLKNIQKGDEISIDRAGKKFFYKVDQLSVIEPENTQCLRPTKDAELNLITCFPFQYVGSAPRRFVVRARMESPKV